MPMLLHSLAKLVFPRNFAFIPETFAFPWESFLRERLREIAKVLQANSKPLKGMKKYEEKWYINAFAFSRKSFLVPREQTSLCFLGERKRNGAHKGIWRWKNLLQKVLCSIEKFCVQILCVPPKKTLNSLTSFVSKHKVSLRNANIFQVNAKFLGETQIIVNLVYSCPGTADEI